MTKEEQERALFTDEPQIFTEGEKSFFSVFNNCLISLEED